MERSHSRGGGPPTSSPQLSSELHLVSHVCSAQLRLHTHSQTPADEQRKKSEESAGKVVELTQAVDRAQRDQ